MPHDDRAQKSAGARKPKSFKADGTPKKRWSPEERSARGHGPRSRGGQRDRDERRGFGGTDERPPRRASDRAPEPYAGDGRSYGDDRRKAAAQRKGDTARGGYDRKTTGRYDRDERPRKKAWGRDVDPERDVRRADDRPRRGRPERFDRRGGREETRPVRTMTHDTTRQDTMPQDTMEWQEAEELAVDTSTVSGANGFARLGVPAELVAVLEQKGISEPFPIQRASIPDALAGHDVLGRGRTGSGKTLGFTLPLLTRLRGTVLPDGNHRTPQAIILEPTRELAMQVADVLSPLSRALGMRSLLVAGGMSYEPQRRALSRGVDVIVATPGRLIDLIEQGAADLSDVRVTVLDEADEMADMGFLPEVTRILDETPRDGQRLLFSATLDKGVDGLVKRYLHAPKVHEVDATNATVTTMAHHLVLVKPEHKAVVTAEIANRKGRTIVFARTQKGVDRIAGELREAGVMAGGLHGGLTQGARARVMAAFKDGTVPVLVATDVAARGIHVDDVGLVLQVDPPADSRDYTHRAGRTARAGSEGIVVSLILPHQRRSSLRLAYQAGVHDKAREAKPDEEWLYRATGARKPSAEPIEDAAYEELIAPKQQARRSGGRRFGGHKPYRQGGRRRG